MAKGNVPGVTGTGVRQFSGILSVTDFAGNNAAVFTGASAVIGNPTTTVTVTVLAQGLATFSNVVMGPPGNGTGTTLVVETAGQNPATDLVVTIDTVGNAALRLINNATVPQTSIDFLNGSVMAARVRSGSFGGLAFVATGSGAHSFWVGGDTPGGTIALTIASNASVMIADSAGALFAAGFAGWPENIQNGSTYTTVAADANKAVLMNINGASTVTLGSIAHYPSGSEITVAKTNVSGNITVQPTGGDSLLYNNGGGVVSTNRTVPPGGSVVVENRAGVWFVSGGVAFT